MKFKIFIGYFITPSTSFIIGFGRFNTSILSKIDLTAPGVLLKRKDKAAYLLTSPSTAL